MNRKILFLFCSLLLTFYVNAEKKPLDHSVYDLWESVTQVLISNDGLYTVYVVAPQDGDSILFVSNLKTQLTTRIDRGYNAQITDDSRYVVFQIKPSQSEKKEARKQKKPADEQPADSLGWLPLGAQTVERLPDVKSFKMPEKRPIFLPIRPVCPKIRLHKKRMKNRNHSFYTISKPERMIRFRM